MKMLSFVILFIVSVSSPASAKKPKTLSIFVSRPSPTISAMDLCNMFDDFTAKQTNFCMKNPRVVSVIGTGIQIGLHECQNKFQHHRWNCTSTHPETGSFGQNRAIQGTKEAAFVNAIVAAGVAYSVTSACANNNITGCICAEGKGRGTTQKSWEDKGCTNNIAYGIDISKRFLDGSRGPFRKKYELQVLHNREAGRLVVGKSVDFQCSCHGISGACTSKSCWVIHAATFERVGAILKQRYEKAVHVSTSFSKSREGKIPRALVLPRTVFVKPPKEKLVYLDKSPIYCDPLPEKGVAGTKGRVCNPHSKGSDSCDTLCCGRGYNKIAVTTKKRCKCHFFWCCEVRCQICRSDEEKTVCK